MTVRFTGEAQREFLDAIAFYEETCHGLGRRFKGEVDRCISWIAGHPELYRLKPGGYRRINLRVVTYYVPYIVRRETLWVLAIAHASRQPHYWISRRDQIP